jgi:hypothetical protein
LVGISQARDEQRDEELAHTALQELGLVRARYRLDATFNPPEIESVDLSAASGALTRYTYRVFRVESLSGRLERPETRSEELRWFTWDEIQQGRGANGEPIMRVTATIMAEIDAKRLPVSVSEAADFRPKVRIGDEILNRISYGQIGGVLSLLALSLFFLFIPGLESDTLDRLDKYASILSAVFGAAGLVVAVLALRR